jgi:cytidylate kinase
MLAPVPLIITISRQVGSGGAEVGRAVAHRLGIRYVDGDLRALAAKRLAVHESVVQQLEERRPTGLRKLAAALGFGSRDAFFVPAPVPVLEQDVIDVESQLIREIATGEDSVILGRGASWILRDLPGVVRVFLYAPERWRSQRIRQSRGLAGADAALDVVHRSDRQRQAFIEYLGGPAWADCERYDCCLDTAAVGLDAAVDFVVELAGTRVRTLRAGSASRPVV